jgi:hypothetical protein
MTEYPGFVPSRFAMGRFRGWGARDPRRVIAWFGGVALVAVGVVTVGVVARNLALIIGGGVALADMVVEGAIYVPRALRAMHQRPLSS